MHEGIKDMNESQQPILSRGLIHSEMQGGIGQGHGIYIEG